jgi:hypothetical protein
MEEVEKPTSVELNRYRMLQPFQPRPAPGTPSADRAALRRRPALETAAPMRRRGRGPDHLRWSLPWRWAGRPRELGSRADARPPLPHRPRGVPPLLRRAPRRLRTARSASKARNRSQGRWESNPALTVRDRRGESGFADCAGRLAERGWRSEEGEEEPEGQSRD